MRLMMKYLQVPLSFVSCKCVHLLRLSCSYTYLTSFLIYYFKHVHGWTIKSSSDTYELSPFCMEALSVLRSAGINFKEVSLGKEWIPGLIKSPTKRATLLEMTGQSSLPHVFVGGTSIGGLYSGKPGLIPALERGELVNMVDEAKKKS